MKLVLVWSSSSLSDISIIYIQFSTCISIFSQFQLVEMQLFHIFFCAYCNFGQKWPFFGPKSAIMDFFRNFFLTFWTFTTVQIQWDQNQVNAKVLFRVMAKNAWNSEKCHFFINFGVCYVIPPLLGSTRQNWKLKLYYHYVCT